MSTTTKTYHLHIQIDAPTVKAARALRDEIVGACEDARERGDPATAIVGSLETTALFTDRELATVLAALRVLQQLPRVDGRPAAIEHDISGYFDTDAPLTTDQIDDLCERLNSR